MRTLRLALVLGTLVGACTEGGVVGGECRAGACGGEAGADASADAPGGDAPQDADGSHDADGAPDGGASGDGAADADGQPPHDGPLHDVPPADADGGGDGDAGAGEGGGDACTPPYDTPEHCGSCFTSCGPAAPVCAPVDGGHACVPACAPPLMLCAGNCVDPQTDADHCGGCGVQCPSGLCQGGKCVGQNPGHVVLVCASYEQAFQSSSQTALLGNAVFLPPGNPVRILGYTEHTPAPVRNKLNQALGWAAAAKGRTYTLTEAASSAAVASQLVKTSYDVLLVYDQPSAPAGTLGTVGTAWNAPVAAFLALGGVVVVASGGGGTAETHVLVKNAGLAPVSQQTGVPTGAVLVNQAPFDAVGLNVLSPFAALKQTCAWSTSATPGPGTVFVVGTQAGGGPVVIHRIP